MASTSFNAFPAASVQLSTTPGNTLYTCPAGARAQIQNFMVLNTTATDRALTVHVVRSGDSIADNNQVVSAMTIPKKTTAPAGIPISNLLGMWLNAGDTIQAFSSAGTALTPFGGVMEYFL